MPDNEDSQGAFILSEKSIKLLGGFSEWVEISSSFEKPAGEYSAKLFIEDTEHGIRIEKPLKLTVLSADTEKPVITAKLIGAPKKVKRWAQFSEMPVELTYNYGKDEDGNDITETQTVQVSRNMADYNFSETGTQTVTIRLNNYNTEDLTFEVEVVDYITGITYYGLAEFQWEQNTEPVWDGKVQLHLPNGVFGDKIHRYC